MTLAAFPTRSKLTDHAHIRMQQRGIPRLAVEYLLAYGKSHHDSHGGRIVYFDESSLTQLARDNGRETLRKLHRHLDAYAVVTHDGGVATVGHRYKRLRRR